MFRISRRKVLTFSISLIIGLLCVPTGEFLAKTARPINKTEKIVFGPNETTSKQRVIRSPAPVEETAPERQPGFCHDQTIKPIWNAIRWDKEVREALDEATSTPDCREIFEIRYVDLDRQGRKEILARVLSVPFCGAVGNCDLFILKQTRKGLRLLLHANDYIDATDMGDQVLRTRTNGYLDILTKGHFSAAETSHTTYKFNGRRYVEAKCRYSVPKYGSDGKQSRAFISCGEFHRRLDSELSKMIN